MGFIEREKERFAQEKHIEDEERHRIDEARKHEQRKTEEIRARKWEKVGDLINSLLERTRMENERAVTEGLEDPTSKLTQDNEILIDWIWEVDWEGETPRLWGHFKQIKGHKVIQSDKDSPEDNYAYQQDDIFDNKGQSPSFASYLRGYWYRKVFWRIYIKCLFDTEKMTITVTAEALRHDKTEYFKEPGGRTERVDDNSIRLHADYMPSGFTIPIETNKSYIEKIADYLIEIRYTWQVAEKRKEIEAERAKLRQEQAKLREQREFEKKQLEEERKIRVEKERIAAEKKLRRKRQLRPVLLGLGFGIRTLIWRGLIICAIIGLVLASATGYALGTVLGTIIVLWLLGCSVWFIYKEYRRKSHS